MSWQTIPTESKLPRSLLTSGCFDRKLEIVGPNLSEALGYLVDLRVSKVIGA